MFSKEKKFKSGFERKLEELFGLDLRSLALFRIGLALLVVTDLINRSKDLKAHYTDFGILPRAPLIEQFLNSWFWSVHLFSGQALFQSFLFLFAGFIAFALLIGYRTRFVTIVSWALLVSLHSRNPMVLSAGDIEFRLLLFWAMFLPLGACYSVDSALNSSSKALPERILSGATVALTLQICFVYWFTWALKSDPIWWKEGSAVYYALSIDQFATPIGQFFLGFPPPLLVFLTYTTLGIELLGPFLLFIPIRTSFFRLCAVVTFILLHLGFGLGLTLGLFPFISAIAWLVFIPSEFWNGISQRLQTPQRQGLKIYYDGECGFCKKTVYLLRTFLVLPGTPLLLAQDDPEIFADMKTHNSWVVVDWEGYKHFKFKAIAYVCHLSPLLRPLTPLLEWRPVLSVGTKAYEIIANNRRAASKVTAPLKFRPLEVRSSLLTDIIAFLLLLCVSLWNLRTIAPSIFKLPSVVNWVTLVLRLDQKWSMFAPYPLKDDGWYVIPGQLKDGTEIDVFKNGTPVSWEKPRLVSATYPNERWRKYMMNIWSKDNSKYRLYYGRYLCRNWNTQHQGSQQLDTFSIYFMRENTLPNYQTPTVKKVRIWKHSCFNPSPEDN
ncbi:HTTM domain-containing protein [Coleofasciculus sp. FACHB-129]|uniref:DCC1-like thiol-disulfide oxidoreductase family protein n=1 Tax=Cyanophyceae TaxID=3028117 RepID=UPI001682D906|nr:HTTM domain-containing protein [Coleofasciculus sp. FACHB-129]MBD1896331.1 HTTM domain-containing protein [Coleofasciculus sp. FACHB-129]